MLIPLSERQTARCAALLQDRLSAMSVRPEEVWLDLGGLKKVRVLCYHPEAPVMIRRQLAWSVIPPAQEADFTLCFWEEPQMEGFHRRVLGLDVDLDEGDDYILLSRKDAGLLSLWGEIEYKQGSVSIRDGETFYYAVGSMDPVSLLKGGHLFVRNLYRMADTPASALIHGACVGVEGTGVLLCARGSRGKSTLTVSAMLRGFDYVSDDYFVLDKSTGALTASPLYSIITLSPGMYGRLYDDLGPARFVAPNARGDKYVLDIAAWRDAVRWRYPVRACVFPEIAPGEDARVIPCTAQERGRAITHLVHSTVSQMMDQGNAATVRKLIGMLGGLDFYRIRLSADLYRNVGCLRDFILGLNA